MAKRTSLRLMQTIAGITMAANLVACGHSPVPMAAGPIGASTVSRFATTPTPTHRFGLTFNARTPRVKNVVGGISAGLPGKVDLRSAQTAIRDQGQIGSCTGFAIAGLAEFLEKKQGGTEPLSPAFIYTLELQAEGNLGKDEGAEIKDGISILNKQGIAPEALQPYLGASFQSPDAINTFLGILPSTAAIQAALAHRARTVTPVNDLAQFKTALAQGNPVVFGIPVYSSIENPGVAKTGILPVPDVDTEKLLGGHALLAVGYDDQKKAITFKNSWSSSWGEKGYGSLPYGWFAKNLVMDSWQAK